MSHRKARRGAAWYFLILAMASPLGALAAQRTFVSTNGSDSNTASNCSNTAPCRGFAAALTVTDSGGEIIVQNSGGYGPVTINKSVSIIAPEGIYAGVSVFTGNGVTIGTPSIDAVLKGLSINHMGGSMGVNMTAGNSVTVEKCTIQGFASGNGIYVGTAATARVLDSTVINNYYGVHITDGALGVILGSRIFGNTNGVFVDGSAGTNTAEVSRTEAAGNTTGFYALALTGSSAKINIKDSVASRNDDGVYVLAIGGTAQARVANSLVTGNGHGLYSYGSGARLVASGNLIAENGTGLYQGSSAVLVSTVDNTMSDNTADTAGTIGTLVKK